MENSPQFTFLLIAIAKIVMAVTRAALLACCLLSLLLLLLVVVVVVVRAPRKIPSAAVTYCGTTYQVLLVSIARGKAKKCHRDFSRKFFGVARSQ